MTYWKAKRTGILLLTLLVILLSTGSVAAQGEDEARVGFFEDVEIQPGSRVEVPVRIEDVQDLYAIDIEIQFDPQVIKIQDADSDADGIQPALGTFLDAGLTLFNSADNEAGVIRFVMSQINPSEPKSGDGIILVLYIEGAAEGESDLEITILDLSTRAGDAISAQSVDGKVTVSEAAAAKEATSIPVQDPTSMVIVPTSQPTERLAATPTSQPTERPETTPTKTATPAAEETEPQASQTLETLAGATEEEKDAGTPPTQAAESESEQQNTEVQTGFSLVRYWWVVALVLGIAIGLGVYLLSTRKKG